MVEPEHPEVTIAEQGELLGLARSSYSYQPMGETEENLPLMRLLDEQYSRTPFYEIRRMRTWLRTQGYQVNEKRVARLLRLMGLEAISPKPRLSLPDPTAHHSPYLLKGVRSERVNQVWSTDIPSMRTTRGFVYLVAIMDWFSRYVLAWEISVTLDVSFCLDALERALNIARPEIFNSDQGVQFTSHEFPNRLQAAHSRISRDGRGRALDNIFVERLWRNVKYEEVYLKDYDTVPMAVENLKAYFIFSNQERLHQALGYVTPATVYSQR